MRSLAPTPNSGQPENLSADGRADLKKVLATNRDLAVVYVLKDAFKQVWIYTYRKCAQKCLSGWIGMAMESGIAELKRYQPPRGG